MDRYNQLLVYVSTCIHNDILAYIIMMLLYMYVFGPVIF